MTGARTRWVLAVAVLAAALGAAPPAGAHGYLVESSPPNESVVPHAPREVRLVFSEPVDFSARAIELLDAKGNRIATPPPRHATGSPNVALLPVPPAVPRGTYVVAWRVVSSDSHPVSGGFSFSVGAPSAAVAAHAPRTSRAIVAADAAGRWLAFAALALTVGGAFFVLALWPEGRRSRRARRLLWAGIGAMLVSTLVLILAQGPYATAGSFSDAFSRSLLDFTLSTRFGHALAARLGLTVVFALLIAAALYRRLHGLALALPAAACALGLVATWTLSDHSSTGIQTWLGIPVASVHLLAMALWLGGLTFLLACVLGRGAEERAVVLPRFSRLGLVSFSALAASGVYLAWRQVGTLAALPATEFGQLLLVKSAIVAGIVGLAAISRTLVRRPSLIVRLRRSVSGESVLGVAVLAVTAVLVNAVPARISYTPPLSVEVAGPAGTALGGGTVQVKVKPAKEGDNVADVYLVGSDGFLLPATDVSGRLASPGERTTARAVELTQAEPGHFVASRMSVPYRGRWILHLDVDDATVDAPLTIR